MSYCPALLGADSWDWAHYRTLACSCYVLVLYSVLPPCELKKVDLTIMMLDVQRVVFNCLDHNFLFYVWELSTWLEPASPIAEVSFCGWPASAVRLSPAAAACNS